MWLIAPPNAFKKESKIHLNIEAIIRDALPSKSVSSMNWEWLILLVPLTIWILGKFPTTLYDLIFQLRDSTIIMNKRGNRGHPCLNPSLLWKKYVGHLLTCGVIHDELIQDVIQWIKVWMKPNLLNTLKINTYLSQSKAFFISNFSIIPSSLTIKLEWIAYCTKIMLFVICLLCINPPWLA